MALDSSIDDTSCNNNTTNALHEQSPPNSPSCPHHRKKYILLLNTITYPPSDLPPVSPQTQTHRHSDRHSDIHTRTQTDCALVWVWGRVHLWWMDWWRWESVPVAGRSGTSLSGFTMRQQCAAPHRNAVVIPPAAIWLNVSLGMNGTEWLSAIYAFIFTFILFLSETGHISSSV